MDSFKFRQWELPYCTGSYNTARLNERAVEVPVAQLLMLEHGPAHTLEIGAVLPHYAAHTHICVDRDERWPNVINADVLTWEPNREFSLVLSISTLEHLDSLETMLTALERMRGWLKPGGELMITLPYGWGGAPWLAVDDLEWEALGPSELCRYDKIDTTRHLWQPADLSDPWKPYNGASTWANSVLLLFWKRGRK